MINIDNISAALDNVAAAAAEMDVVGEVMTVPVGEIFFNPKNTAAKNDTSEQIKDLADSIATGGLIHPLTVNETSDGRYMLLSGERRYRAITEHLGWTSVPCNVYHNLSDDMAAMITVIANMQVREYTVSDRLELYEQLSTALRNLKNAGKYKGGIGRGIAQILQVSERQVSAYKQICENITPDKRKEITNIDRAVENVRRKKANNPEKEKTYGDRKFLDDEAGKIVLAMQKKMNKLKRIFNDRDALDELEICQKAAEAIDNLEQVLKGQVR